MAISDSMYRIVEQRETGFGWFARSKRLFQRHGSTGNRPWNIDGSVTSRRMTVMEVEIETMPEQYKMQEEPGNVYRNTE